MSLINEALKQARVEAARQDAAAKGVPPEALPRYVPEQRRGWLAPMVGFAAGLVAVAVAAGALWLVRQPTAPERTVAEPAQVAATQPRTQVVELPSSIGRDAEVHASSPGAPVGRPDTSPPSSGASGEMPPPGQSSPDLPSPDLPSPDLPSPDLPSPAPTASTATPVETAQVDNRPSPPIAAESAEAPAAQTSAPQTAAPQPVADRSSAPAAAKGAEGQIYLRQASPAGAVIKVDFIVWSENPFAQINGELLSVGQSIDGYSLLNIERERVELEGGGVRFWIRVK